MKTSFLSSSKARIAFMMACFGLIVAFASCGKKYDPVPEPVGDLDIRAVNAVNDPVGQDLLVNGAVKVSALGYAQASAYVKMTSGTSTIGFYNTGTTTTMNAGGTTGLPIGAKVSVYYFKTGKGSAAATLYDDATANPTTGKAKVRFVLLNSFLDTTIPTPISVLTQGGSSPLISALEFVKASDYFEVDAGTKFIFTPATSTTGVTFDGGIVANKIYTIWIDGTSPTNLTGHIVAHN